MENNTEEKKTPSKNSSISLASSVLVLFNGIFTAYVVNFKPKIGEYHIRLCSALGVLLALFTVWTVVWCIRSLKKGEGSKTMLVLLIALALLMGITWTYTAALHYYKDFIGGSRTVTTDSYLVVHDNLHFLDNEGNEVRLTIPKDTASELWAKENYEYDYENNLLKYYDKITVTYFPESKVIISVSAGGQHGDNF